MRNSSMSRSKMLPTGSLEGVPNIPILETEDLPSEADWIFVKSLRFDQVDLCDMDPDPYELTELVIGRVDVD